MSDSSYSNYLSFSKSIINLENSVRESSNFNISNNSLNSQYAETKYDEYKTKCNNDNVFHCNMKTYNNLMKDFSK